MKFNLRRVGDYIDVTLFAADDNKNFGLLNHKELQELQGSIEDMLGDITWAVNVTEPTND
jgi:hypothetical protein